MSTPCTSTPISWLRLEQHALGELAGDAARATEAHLAACVACSQRLASLRADDVSLRPLEATTAPRREAPVVELAARRSRWVGALVLAASLALVIGQARERVRRDGALRSPGGEVALEGRVKGDEVAMRLVRDDGVELPQADASYEVGARLKVLVTCPPALHATWDVVVYEGAEAQFPLSPASDLACANDVPLPGAFRLTGQSPVTVCLVWSSAGAPDRAEVAVAAHDEGSFDRRCVRLAPALAR